MLVFFVGKDLCVAVSCDPGPALGHSRRCAGTYWAGLSNRECFHKLGCLLDVRARAPVFRLRVGRPSYALRRSAQPTYEALFLMRDWSGSSLINQVRTAKVLCGGLGAVYFKKEPPDSFLAQPGTSLEGYGPPGHALVANSWGATLGEWAPQLSVLDSAGS